MSDTPTQDPKSPQPEKTTKRSWREKIFDPRWKWPRRVFFALIALAVLMVLGFIIVSSTNLPSLAEVENPKANLSTQLIASDGVVLQNYYADQNRISIRLNQVSPYLVNALIATEDERFYQHSGLDPVFVFSIFKYMLTTGKVRGGSTITQQLARNLFRKVGKDKKVARKVKEMIVAWILERKFTKEEILTAYLNTVNIYGNAFGVEMASQRLFSKTAKELSIEESALLVGMLKGQGSYNPYSRPEAALDRRNTVISKMVEHKMLNPELVDVDSIKAIPLESYLSKRQEQDHVKGLAPYFREHARQFLKKWCNEKGYDLYTDGLKVYTTVDSRMQRHAENAVRTHLTDLQDQFNDHIKGREPYLKSRGSDYDETLLPRLVAQSDRYRSAKKAGKSDSEIDKEFNEPVNMDLFGWHGTTLDTVLSPMDSIRYYAHFLEVGMTSIDPSNGQIKAWVGGINYKHFKYDHVAKGRRQVGSTFKPFVYAAAIDNGWEPCTQVLNQRVQFKIFDGVETKYWEPKNSDGSVGGKVTLRRGLATSLNLVTARLIKELGEESGPRVVVDYAKRMGIQLRKEDAVPSICLGTPDINVLELTGAYTTFVNGGVWTEPVYITRIEDRNGNVLEEFSPTTRKVLSEEKAYLMVELLKGVVDEPGGTAARLRFRYGFDNEIGGKTGTTQNHSDGWFIGVTPNLVSGVWVGCSERQMRFNSIKLGQGANMALPIFALYMKDVYADEDIGLPSDEPFERPENFSVALDCMPTEEENPLDIFEEEQDSQNEFEKYE